MFPLQVSVVRLGLGLGRLELGLGSRLLSVWLGLG